MRPPATCAREKDGPFEGEAVTVGRKIEKERDSEKQKEREIERDSEKENKK